MDHTYSIPPQMENELMMMGLIPTTELDDLEEIIDPRKECMAKGYYRSPYDENNEVLFQTNHCPICVVERNTRGQQ